MLLGKCRRILAAALAIVIIPVSAAYADDVQDSNIINVVACADTYVEGGNNRGVNYGNSETLLAKRQLANVVSNKNDKSSYIKFDLTGISDLSVNEIGKISIMLTNADSADCQASVYATDWTDWNENTLTAEGVEYSGYVDIASNYAHIADINILADETLSINVTEYVRNLMRNRKTAFTLVIIGESNSALTARKLLKIASRETAQLSDRPTLVINKRVPEPITDEDAVDDGYVNRSNPTANFAQEATLLSGNGYTSFFKFNLQESDISTLKSAKLSLYAESAGASLVSARVYLADGSWSGETLSYENMPTKETLCGEIVMKDGERSEIDVLIAVATAVSRGNDSISFVVESDDAVGIASTRSTANRPKLLIETEEVTQAPERDNVSLKFSKESYVRPDTQKDVNFGGELKVKQDMRQAIIEVDFSTLSDLAFSKAILSIYTSDLEPGYSGAANTDVYAIPSDWEQDTITYNNMPERGNLLGSFKMQLDTWSKLDITDYVKEELANGNTRVSVILLQTEKKMNMTISSSNSEENPSALNIYYPLTDEDMSWLAEGDTGGWYLLKAAQSDGVFTLSGDGAKAVSPNYTRNISGNWSENKFLVKACIKTSDASSAELTLAKGKDVYTRLIRTEATDDGVKIYTNTSDDGETQPQNAFSKLFGKDESVTVMAVLENEKISYFINGQAAGETIFAGGLTSEADSIGLFANEGTIEFSNVEMFGYSIYGGNREFNANGDMVITIDSLDSIKIPFTTEIVTTEFYGKLSIDGETVNIDRLSVSDDGKTLIIAPGRNGYEAYTNNLLCINAQNVRDVFGEYATSGLISRYINVTGWNCSAWVTQAERTQGSAEISVKINNTTSETKNISILLVRVSGSEDEYMFEDKIIEDVAVLGNSVVEIDEILLNTISEDGFVKVFVYDNSTYEPMLRVPYTF